MLQATNHTLDAGAAGVDNNLRYWKEHYPQMAVLGIHESGASARDIYVYEKEGFRIAVLNYTYGTNINQELLDAPETACLVDVLDEAVVTEDIRRAGELADYIIVCPHWGTENSYEISEDQRYWTQLFLDNGVDLVLGAHTHVIQPVETLREESGKEMLVYYSLGNCISNQEHADHMVGGHGAAHPPQGRGRGLCGRIRRKAAGHPETPEGRVYRLFSGSVHGGTGSGKRHPQYGRRLFAGLLPGTLPGCFRSRQNFVLKLPEAYDKIHLG